MNNMIIRWWWRRTWLLVRRASLRFKNTRGKYWETFSLFSNRSEALIMSNSQPPDLYDPVSIETSLQKKKTTIIYKCLVLGGWLRTFPIRWQIYETKQPHQPMKRPLWFVVVLLANSEELNVVNSELVAERPSFNGFLGGGGKHGVNLYWSTP